MVNLTKIDKGAEPRRFRKCPKCGHIHDGALDLCPKCGEASGGPLLETRFPNVIMVPFLKQIFLFLIGWGGLTLVSFLVSWIFIAYANSAFADQLAIDAFLSSNKVSIMINLICYTTLIVGLVALLWNDVFRLLSQFKALKPLISGVSYGALLIVATIAYSLIVKASGYEMGDNENETSIVALMTSYPVASFLTFVLLGPVVEEITYRVGLFSFIRRLNRPVAYVATMLIFGVIHMSFDASTIINELVNLPSYIIAGTILTIAYEKEGFACSTYAHITNNLVSFLLTIIQF